MAKDGTNRGGRRPGAGRPKKSLAEKLMDGNVGHRPIKAISPDSIPDLEGVEMPPPHQMLSDPQRDGTVIEAKAIYEETWNWLKARNCAAFVSSIILHAFSMSAARWIQLERAISKNGFLMKHPTTGNPILSPYVNASANYMSQTERLWNSIFNLVEENCSTEVSGVTPHDNVMERLLQASQGM